MAKSNTAKVYTFTDVTVRTQLIITPDNNCKFGNPWTDFKNCELTEIIRQKDKWFAELLNRLGIKKKPERLSKEDDDYHMSIASKSSPDLLVTANATCVITTSINNLKN